MKKSILTTVCLLTICFTSFSFTQKRSALLPAKVNHVQLYDPVIFGPSDFNAFDPYDTWEVFWMQEGSYNNYWTWSIEKLSGDNITTGRDVNQPEHRDTEVFHFYNNTGSSASATFRITCSYLDYTNTPVEVHKDVTVHF